VLLRSAQDSYQVSVVIPCYNAGVYVSEAVESVLAQVRAVRSLEVVIVDDHSSDAVTLARLDRWRQEGSGVRVIRNTGRRGPGAARNRGIHEASGEWIAFLDADDVWRPGGLQARWAVAESEPDAQWIAADFQVLSQDGSVAAVWHNAGGNTSRVMLAHAYATKKAMRLVRPVTELLQCSVTATSTVMVKRALVQEVGGFDERLWMAQDQHLWLRLARCTDLFFVPQSVALYREHAASHTHQALVPDSWDIVAYSLLWRDPDFRTYRADLGRRLAELYHGISYQHSLRGEWWQATQAAAGGLRFAPMSRRSWKKMAAVLLRRC
jgi:glycosyltransferase involved in cell wall biosynthesis